MCSYGRFLAKKGCVMWKLIATAGLTSFLLRASPAFIKRVSTLNDYPKLNKFLDYTICLITGEVIYSVAFKEIPASSSHYVAIFSICAMTLCLAGAIMWRTSSLAKSFTIAIGFFILAYCFGF